MAFNWSTFKTRTGTAIIFAAVMLTGLLWSHWSFLILFSVIHFGCWWEYLKFTEKIYRTTFHIYTKLGWMLMGYGIMLLFCSPAFAIADYGLRENLSLPVSGAGFVLLIVGIFQSHLIRTKAMMMAALGVVYISLSWGLMMDLTHTDLTSNNLKYLPQVKGTSQYLSDIVVSSEEVIIYSIIIPVTVIFSIWVNDTMAYIVGTQIGKTPLSKISPKKTWEGTIGGIILAIVSMGFLSDYFSDLSFLGGLTIAAIAAIAGTFGDLLESKLKRMAGVKDSGSIMPGHGGFLDRFDSLLLATPVVWLYVKLLML